MKRHTCRTTERAHRDSANAYKLAALAASAVIVVLLNRTSNAQPVDIGVGSAFQRQTFQAWGTSLAWFGNALGKWTDSAAHADVMDLLFDGPNHLGLNYARYNIGGGQNLLLVGNFRPGAAVPGWAPLAPGSVTDTSTWNWDWNADPGQRKSLQAAIDRGVTKVDAVSYSAPYWMTDSHDTAGAVGGGDNLQTSLYDEFAHYQTEVLKHFRQQRGIQFATFAPMNEPHASWWQAGGGQEGMHVSQGFNQRLLIETVGQALAAKGLDIGVSGGDEFSASISSSAFQQYNATTVSYIKQLNTHVYGGAESNPTSAMQALRDRAASMGVPLYQSEYGNNSSSALVGGMDLAYRITTDLNVMGVNGWTFWQAVEPLTLSGAGWGLLWADYNVDGSKFVVRKQYHVMRQFTSYIRAGATILRTNDDETVAAYNAGSDMTALVFTNDQTTADTNVYRLLDKMPAYSRVIRTDSSGDYVSLGPADVAGSQVTVDAPGSSVTTAVVHHRPNLVQNAGFNGDAGEWQITGNAVFNQAVDNTRDGSGGVILQSNGGGRAGAVWQPGIGSPLIDLTGKAYEFSADLLFQNNNLQFDADARIALEFYGADGQTLVHASPSDFAEALRPISQDSRFRVFRTDVVQAPVGARFVRPVVQFDDVAFGATGLIYLDNAYLQETRYVPRARAWNVDADGDWHDADNWQNDALVENNRAAYFGPQASRNRTITVSSNVDVTGITFDSEFGYRIAGDATLAVGNGGEPAKLDVRSGSHAILAPVAVNGPVVVQVVGDAKLSVDTSWQLNGRRMEKTGSGKLTLARGFSMDGGELSLQASLRPSLIIGADAELDGTLALSLPAGEKAVWGRLYTLAEFAAPEQSFDDVSLPTLEKPWLAWEVRRAGASQLVAEVVNRVDFNRDGEVDAADKDQLSNSYGMDAKADANGDGITDGMDFLLWQQALGEVERSNTLLLLVDPSTGDARIENRSFRTITFDAYTIGSDSSSLRSAWRSLEDQGRPGWIEALPSSGRLSELNPTGSLSLVAGAAVSLPGLFNAASGLPDLHFQFRDVELGAVNGRVAYANFGSWASDANAVPEPTGLTFDILLAAPFVRRAKQRGSIDGNARVKSTSSVDRRPFVLKARA
ncbi:MAG: hypothetical protein DCC67_05020 [Planctomycetota bacterium]|nr:MAG: hypothetical protein DCC67_05020 [Planctomycetota bacterium]